MPESGSTIGSHNQSQLPSVCVSTFNERYIVTGIGNDNFREMRDRWVIEGNAENSAGAAKSGETQNAQGQALEQDAQSKAEASSPAVNTGTDSSHEELCKLGEFHLNLFRRYGDLKEITKAIEYGIRALDSTPNGHPDLPDRHASLGVSYTDRFRRLGERVDLENSIKHKHQALKLTPAGHPDLPHRHTELGVSYTHRFRLLGELDDLEKAIKHDSRALELTPDGHPDLPLRHARLGVSYSDRFGRLDELSDLEKAIEHDTIALHLTPHGHPDLPDRFRHLGEPNDFEKAIAHESLALRLTPEGHPDLPHRHTSLGVSYYYRFQRMNELSDLEKSIEYFSHALDLTPNGHPELPDRHTNLGASYQGRFQRLGKLVDLEKATQHKSRALDLTPQGDPDLPLRYASLGVSYGYRFQRLGELADLENAIEHLSRAVDLTPDDHPHLPRRHADLGVSYHARFQRLGELSDLEKAIQYISHSVDLIPNGHPDLSQHHAILAASYHVRFQRLGELLDLENSTQHRLLALDLTPEDHPDLPLRHAELGVSYQERFQRLDELIDLEKAIEHKARALDLTPGDHPDLPERHAELGISYQERFQLLHELNDLEKAINYKSCALGLTPDGHPELPRYHASLGVAYRERFQHQCELVDLERAIEHGSHAINLTPEDHPNLSWQHYNLALSCFLQYQHTNHPAHLSNSLNSFRQASQLSIGPPREKFRHALGWAMLASNHAKFNCIEAYQATIDLLPEFIWLGATTNQQYKDLSTAENLAINAAFAAIGESDYTLALEWLEQARCVVWNQRLMLQSPLDDLQSSYPSLATRLRAVTEQLRHTGSEDPATRALISGTVNPEQVGQQRRHLAQKYNKLLAEARTLPGFEDFLRPKKAGNLLRAAHNGPIVIISCHQVSSDALIIIPGLAEVKRLSLPSFTAENAKNARSELETSLRRKGLRERGVKVLLPSGYKDRMENFLGFKNGVTVDNLPHITWCPTGALSFLPLHAAGDYSQPRSRVFNYVISSYTPTITALLACSPSSLHNTSRVLAIGQPNTPGRKPLPGTTTELACLETHTQNKFQYSQLIDDQATIANVLDAMKQHDWVHLACHAHQNVDDPTKSGFFLHDGTLDLASINRRSFRNKGLAFLSACQTATGDEKLPDEAIHLASGMLMAGYSSVIGTMWSVVDADAPLIADKVYEELMKEGKVGNGEAGKALHEAVGALRDKIGEKEFVRWVPYIHIGR
ncbi:hypothetical protein OPQ81_005011 [Rhizoctonia solani]|nr:hypothetical protein OPQ81_005011 [Rhizoctonia solani]